MSPARVQLTPRLAAMLASQERVQVAEKPEPQKPSKADERAEAELQADCQAILAHRGVRFRFHMRNARGNMRGVPDELFAYRPRGQSYAIPCAWEYKVKGGRLDPEQEERIEEMRLDGWHVAVIWSVQQAKEFLDAMETNQEQNQ